MTSQLGNKCNRHIANISRSKGNQTLKFGQLIEYDMRTLFKKIKTEHVSGSIVLSFIQFAFIVNQVKTIERY